MADVLASADFGDEIEDADAAAILGRDVGELAQSDKSWAIDVHYGDVGDDQGPFRGLELGKKLAGILDVADAPAFRVEDLFDRTGALGIVVEDKNANLARLNRGISTHRTIIA
jgi:hypothetical protein